MPRDVRTDWQPAALAEAGVPAEDPRASAVAEAHRAYILVGSTTAMLRG